MRRYPLWLVVATLLAGAAGADPGDLLWQDLWDRDGAFDGGRAVVASRKVVVVAGSSGSPGTPDLGFVRAYDARSGEFRWDEVFGAPGLPASFDALAARGRRVFVGGGAEDGATAGSAAQIRAFDARDGSLLWADSRDATTGPDATRLLAAKGGALFAIVESDAQVEVVGYRTRNGAVHFARTLERGGDEISLGGATAVGRRLFFAAATEEPVSEEPAWWVQAVDAKTGEPLWDDTVDEAGSEFAAGVAAKGSRVFAAGKLIGGTSADFAVRALRAGDGGFLWEDRYDLAGVTDFAEAIAVRGRLVVAVGSSISGPFTDPSASNDWLVRAYDAKTGQLLWDDVHDADGGVDVASAVSISRRGVAVAGVLEHAGQLDFALRVYDRKSGALLFDDTVDGAGGDDEAHGVFADRKAVFAVGNAEDALGESDLLLRALSLR